MDGWMGDLVQMVMYLSVAGLLAVLFLLLESICTSSKQHDDVANWQQHLENERIQLTARRMVREVEEEERLDRMWEMPK